MKTRKLTQNDVGRFLTVHFNDTGKQDALLIEVLDKDDFRIYLIASECTGSVDTSQIMTIGPYLTVPKF